MPLITAMLQMSWQKQKNWSKAGAINDYEAEQYQNWAYRRLLSEVTDARSLKACLKHIPESLKSGELCVAIAEKYERLGLYADAVKWVKTHYPQTRQPELLEAFVESVRFLSEREQQKAIDLADSWLQEQPDNCTAVDVSWPTGLRPQTLGQSPRLPRSQHRPATQRIRTFGLGSRV